MYSLLNQLCNHELPISMEYHKHKTYAINFQATIMCYHSYKWIGCDLALYPFSPSRCLSLFLSLFLLPLPSPFPLFPLPPPSLPLLIPPPIFLPSPHNSADIMDRMAPRFHELGLRYECLGGGRLNHSQADKKLHAYGYSVVSIKRHSLIVHCWTKAILLICMITKIPGIYRSHPLPTPYPPPGLPLI